MATNALPRHGITADTPSNIPFGAGTWFKNLEWNAENGWSGTVLGATSGGSSVKIVNEIKDLEIDGALALAMGFAIMQGGSGEAEVNFAELNSDILKYTTLGEILQPGNTGYVEGFDCIQTKNAIVKGDYVENLGFVGYTADQSKQIIVILDYALCKSGFQLDPKNKENSVIKATFTAYGDITTDLDRVPIRIYYPQSSAA